MSPLILHSFVQRCIEHFIRSCKWYSSRLRIQVLSRGAPHAAPKRAETDWREKKVLAASQQASQPLNSDLRGSFDVETPFQQSSATYESARAAPLHPASTCSQAIRRDVVHRSINSRSSSHQTQQHNCATRLSTAPCLPNSSHFYSHNWWRNEGKGRAWLNRRWTFLHRLTP